ncbi:MAG: pilus assembly protein PilX, partial [Burkholderiales bacterium]|nr:pilus assembly protein PilX [Burkholderiales bacterium]
MHSPSSTARPAAPHRERGIALFVVIVFVMLSMLLALWASRTAIFNEMVVGNDADYQRAFEAAQSLIQDAELDIRRWNDIKNFPNHRPDDKTALDALFTEDKFYDFFDSLNTAPFCKNGLCVKRRGRQDFWNNHTDTTEADDPEVSFEQMTRANNAGKRGGARYGAFTKASFNDPANPDVPANPILADRSADDRGGWYWIEVLSYAAPDAVGGTGLIVNDDPNAAAPTDLLDLRLKPSVVYRITAWARGLKPNSTAVIQETYA